MALHFMPSFLRDLKDSNDQKFCRRVLSHVVDENGNFVRGRDDHRYKGIQDCWIRYVSAGVTAYRVIFIQKGTDVYLYRAGVHSVEDNLAVPKSLEGPVIAELALALSESAEPPKVQEKPGEMLKTEHPLMLSKLLNALFFVRHKQITLVSPFYSEPLLGRQGRFGQFLDRAIEEDTIVVFITKASEGMNLDFFKSLEERGIFVYFHPSLHTKLYLFDVDEASLNKFTKNLGPTAILGSANLTERGLSMGIRGNEELCYRLPQSQFEDAANHATWLQMQSMDYLSYRSRFNRRF